MSAGKKKLIICTIFPALASVVLITVAMSTNYWVISSPEKTNSTRENSVNFGLFKGHKVLDFGNGQRSRDIKAVCDAAEGVCAWHSPEDKYKLGDELLKQLIQDHKNSNSTDEPYKVGLFDYGLWVTTILMAVLGIVFGLISIGFAIFNAVGKPIETITGPLGLYLWNGLAFFFTLVAVVVYLVLFFAMYKKNFLNDIDLQFKVDETTFLGYSFYLVVGATVLYFINIILLFISGYKLRCSFGSEAEKVVDNGIILF